MLKGLAIDRKAVALKKVWVTSHLNYGKELLKGVEEALASAFTKCKVLEQRLANNKDAS